MVHHKNVLFVLNLIIGFFFVTSIAGNSAVLHAQSFTYQINDLERLPNIDSRTLRLNAPKPLLVVQPVSVQDSLQNDIGPEIQTVSKLMTTRVRRNTNRKAKAWFADLDVKYWQMRRRDLDYAASSSNTALAIGEGTIHELVFDADSGFQASMGYATEDGWKIGFRYTNFRTDENDSLIRAPGETLFSTRSHPKFNEEAITADVDSLFDMNIFDFEVRGPIVLSERASLNVFGGIRWADVDQEFNTVYDGFDFVNGEINNLHSMDAVGLRLGGEGTWTLLKGLYLFGGAETSLMYGSHETSLRETDEINGVRDVLVNVSDKYQQAITSLSTTVGLGLNAKDYEFRIGYEFNVWYNLADRLVFLDDTHEAIFSHSNHDVVLDGFFARMSVKF